MIEANLEFCEDFNLELSLVYIWRLQNDCYHGNIGTAIFGFIHIPIPPCRAVFLYGGLNE